jgi:MFS family permease
MTTRGVGRVHYAWVIIGGTALALLAASGVRSAFGVFIKPMETKFGWDRAALSLVASLSFLFNGPRGPIDGRLADRWGPRVVLACFGILLGAGSLGAALVAFAATLVVLAIRERPVSRRPPAMVVAVSAPGA